MTEVRSALYLVFLALSVVVFAVPISIFGWFLSDRALGRLGGLWGKANLAALAALCGLRYRATGLEHLPQGPCVFLCKHQSTWETIALRGLLPPAQAWILKRELLWVPFFGWGLAAFRPIAIDRKAGRRAVRQVLEDGQKWLARGRCVVVFPEGTRVAPGTRHRYGVGGALLAERAGAPVVPIAHNAGVFWRRREFRKHPGTIDLVIGEAFSTEGMTAAEINRRAEDWIETQVAALPQSD
jgi:1-acyl-sn-glycerol-3-phosphate acyltransferase